MEKEQAQARHTSAFVRIGQSTWFTLESSLRSKSTLEDVDERFKALADYIRLQQPETAIDLETQSYWKIDEWIRFLSNVEEYAEKVFLTNDNSLDDEEEKELFDTFLLYKMFYDALPERPSHANDEDTMERTKQHLDKLLGKFQDRLGDPTVRCEACGKCARGYPLKRCSRCKLVSYCSRDCQKDGWKNGHRRICKPIQNNPRLMDQMIRQRFNQLRRQGKDTKTAMAKARAEFQVDQQHVMDAGSQVASMFGL